MNWNDEDPLHKEIMDAAKEAFIAKNTDRLKMRHREVMATLPWYLRLYIKVEKWLTGFRR